MSAINTDDPEPLATARAPEQARIDNGMEALAQLLRRADVMYELGEWAQAEMLCRSVLDSRPEQFDALDLLGIIAAQTNRSAEAERLLRRAVASRPDAASASNNLGNVLRDLGQHEQALACFARALHLNPNYFEAHNNHGNTLQALRRSGEALLSYDAAIRLNPDYAVAHCNRASTLRALGRLEEALASFERAISVAPNLAEGHYNRGVVLMDLRRFEEALASFERALQIRPAFVEAHYYSGVTLQELGRLEQALTSYERALQLKVDCAEAHSNRGSALQELGRLQEALQSYQRAFQLKPDYADAYANLGVWHYLRNEPEAAVIHFTRAIDLRPDDASAHTNRGFAALLAGDFANGWADHEWRWRARPGLLDPRYPDRTLWLGSESLAGKSIVLRSEQGHGDTLQFGRYAKLVAELGATVILEVAAPLATLMATLEGVSQVVVRGERLPAFDYHCPLMSLPLAFRTTLATIPARVPYLVSDRDKRRYWKERLGPWTQPRVGLVWSGGFRPDQPQLWSVNNRRNVPLAKLAPLRDAQISFYSLQKGEPAESELRELKASGWPGPELIDFTASLHDFCDTAALIENLDLIISVDTSIVHLAGALAKPVWIMNRFDSCWRWLLHRTDSPWYPTARLYRQQRPGDWDEVIAKIQLHLSKLAAGRATLDTPALLEPPCNRRNS